MRSVSAKSSTATHTCRDVIVIVYRGVTLLDATGPAQVFSSANSALERFGRPPGYRLVLASPDGGEISSDTGVTVGTVALRSVSGPTDTVIVAGGDGVFDAVARQRIIDWLLTRQEQCRRIASTCLGAFVTAEAGLLDGRRATTHWRYVADLQKRHPKVHVQQDPLFIRDGRMWSSAGVTSGIDLALAMVEEDFGHQVAMHVAQSLVVFLKRPGGQSQFSNVLSAQGRDAGGSFSELQAWIADNLDGQITVEHLAERACMSTRTFARHYKNRTGVTPARAVEMMRVDAAKRLLEQGVLSLSRIAAQTGLADEQRLRRAFLRHVGVSPTEYRRKFGARTEH